MTEIPLLPIIESGEILNFHPLFSGNINFELNNNRLIILGGNGMGKTTILQAIIYCIAGEHNSNLEDDTSKRWGKKFFHGRIDNPKEAFVSVKFRLGKDSIELKRSFDRKSIIEFKLNNDLISDNSHIAETEFEEYLSNEAGYKEINDFYFIVHKLCYLPESRPNLVWDIDNQVRLLMLLSSDIVDEKTFREKRALLKNYDSEIRHTNVDINKLKDELENFEASNSKKSIPTKTEDEGKLSNLLEQFGKLSDIRKSLQIDYYKELDFYQEVSGSYETLQDKLKIAEESFILENINQLESDEATLAIYKLIHRKICPACGNLNEELAKRAKKRMQNHECPICGNSEQIDSVEDLDALNSQISEILGLKISHEKKLLSLENELNRIKNSENEIQSELNNYRATRPRLNIIGDVSVDDYEQLKKALVKAEENKATLILMYNDLSDEIENIYETFSSNIQVRINKLADIFKEYATQFLGIECDLHPIKANAKFVDLKLFVPKFDNKIRSTPLECSEAQRFFLDIAFRMALIEFTFELNNQFGSFICETPENALDMTYISNVATMFKNFSSRGHHFIATSNIQVGGLAKAMLSDIKKKEKAGSVLNMLEKARLTKVQLDSIKELNNEVANILK